ncbi:EAL domain-containing protein [Egicoccus sp. AB-alg2]|uniref:EAL domain-containing protein n=1 Tax=Egicoccus sp. AB-alg2 TaxID=3242693 RepID=UPI00359CE02D
MPKTEPAPRPAGGRWWLEAVPGPLAVAAITVLLAVAWAVTYLTGGTRMVGPHAFYLAIFLAAVVFGARGGALTGLVAGILCGPFMPMDVAAGEPQLLQNWLLRVIIFVAIGAAAGAMVRAMRRAYETAIEQRIDQELRLATAPVPAVPPGHDRQVRQLLDERAFHPVFQPIYALSDGRLLGVEALTRFHVDLPGSPEVWFRLAEQAGLGRELELAAMEEAVEAADRAELPRCVTLGLNCSPTTLPDPRLLALVQRAGRPIVLEITEHAVVEDYLEVQTAMHALRRSGARLAVDDAGAGFASLRHIVRLAPEVIKLDRSLTQDLRHDPVRTALADCLIRFAKDTGTELIAEGIEHASDLATWRDFGAHAAQGFHLGRPGTLPVSERCRAILDDGVLPIRGQVEVR